MIAWWIEKPIILACSCPTDRQLLMLYREGFRIIISLIDEREEPPLYDRKTANDIGFVRHNIPVAEGRLPTNSQIERFGDIVPYEGGAVWVFMNFGNSPKIEDRLAAKTTIDKVLDYVVETMKF